MNRQPMQRWALVALLGLTAACSGDGGSGTAGQPAPDTTGQPTPGTTGQPTPGGAAEIGTSSTQLVSSLVLAPKLTGALDLSAVAEVAPKGASVPTAATDARDGSVYLAWSREVPPAGAGEAAGEHDHGDAKTEIVVARSTDGGATFAAPVVAVGSDNRPSVYSVSPPQVRVGPEGNVYVAYEHGVPDVDFGVPDWGVGTSYMHVVRSEDAGKTFSPSVEVAGRAKEGVLTAQGMGGFFVAPDGDLYVSWLDFRNKLDPELRPSPEQDDGQRYSPAKATELRVSRSGDGGRTFSPSTLAGAPTCACCGTHLAQGSDGPLFASTRGAFRELQGSLDEVRDQFVAASTDDGATWSKPAKAHDDGFIFASCPDITAGMAVDSKGRLHVAWHTGTEAHPGVFYAVSADQGRSFSKPLALITDDWVPFGDVKLALDGQDRAWVAFEDRRGEEDLIQLMQVDAGGAGVRAAKSWAGRNPDLAAVKAGEVLVAWDAGDGESPGPLQRATATQGQSS